MEKQNKKQKIKLKKEYQNIMSKFTFDDVLAIQCCMETVKKIQEDEALYNKLLDLHGRLYDACH